MRALLTLLLLTSAIASAAGPSQVGSFVLSCAAFPANLAEADLVARYGQDNVIRSPVFGADDGPQDGAVVFPGAPDARLEVAWRSQGTRSGPMWLKAVGSRWTTSSGIKVGADLLGIERGNGRPFRLAGFQTEGQGVVRSWSGGRLDEPQRAENCVVNIHFQPPYDGFADDGLSRQVRSGLEYSSGHPALQKLNPNVAVIWLRFALRPHAAG
jgi:hypothetical protein